MKFSRLLLAIAILGNLIFAGLLLKPVQVQAATQEACTKSAGGFLGFPTWYKYLDPTFDGNTKECKLNFDLTKDASKVLLAIFEIILRIAGLVSVGFIIFGGFTYLLSQGEPDKIKGARSTIINSFIGLVLAISASGIVNLIARNIS